MPKHESIGDVRGAGLFLGIDFVTTDGSAQPDAQKTIRVVNELRKRRVLIGATGKKANILKIRPQLPFTRDHVDLFIDALDGAISA